MSFFTRLTSSKPHNSSNQETDVMSAKNASTEVLIRKLDIDNAIAAHANWKMRLMSYLNGTSTENFIPEVVCQDNLCALGQWIYQDAGDHFDKKPFFKMLVTWHKRFHLEASTVVSLIQTHQTDAAAHLLANDYQRVSDNVIRSLNQLKKDI